MGNGCGQLTGRREAIDMSKFRHALTRLHFGGAASAMLLQQDQDKPGLYQNDRTNECDLPGVPLPYG